MVYYHIYLSRDTRQYEIRNLIECKLGKYSDDESEYYFAVFTRFSDATNYAHHETGRLARRS